MQPLAPDPALSYLSLPVRLDGESGQTVATGRAVLRRARGPWRGRVFYDGLAVLEDDIDTEWIWEPVPRHRAGATATLTPEPGFSVTGSLTHHAAARWPAYWLLDGANGGLYSMDIPAVWLLDASMQKRLWQERLRLSLLFRNLLNREERYHPVGAALDLRFYLRVELLL